MDELEVAEESNLRVYLDVLKRRTRIIALVTLVAFAGAMAYSFLKTPVYSATATVLVPELQASSALNIQNAQLPASDVVTRALADDQQFAEGDAVKQQARQTLGYTAKVSVGMSTTADVLTFQAQSTNKQSAAAIANAYANSFITARRDNQVSQYTQQVSALEASIAQLQAKEASLSPKDPQLPAIQQSIVSLSQTVQQTEAATQLAGQVGPTVVNAATVPKSPSSPNPVLDGILGFVIGLLLGVGLAFVRERLDDSLNSREAAEAASGGLPIVGLIPMVDAWKSKGSHHLALVEDPTSNVSEAFRTLRTAIQFLGLDEPKRVIGITSSVPDEGKTTAVANLAVSFARAGQRVIVLSCDLRRPKIHAFFGDSDRRGLTSVLLGECSLADAVHPVEGEPLLKVLPSGPVPPNPAEILSLDRVREIVDFLVENCDLLLIDCPPVLPVTDTLLVSRLTDGILVLSSAKLTSRKNLQRTVELLRQVHAPLIGMVLNRVPTDGGYAYGYGYGYGYYSDDRRASGPEHKQLESVGAARRWSPGASEWHIADWHISDSQPEPTSSGNGQPYAASGNGQAMAETGDHGPEPRS